MSQNLIIIQPTSPAHPAKVMIIAENKIPSIAPPITQRVYPQMSLV